jgi:hypothetical protein
MLRARKESVPCTEDVEISAVLICNDHFDESRVATRSLGMPAARSMHASHVTAAAGTDRRGQHS